jgi:hypothetical protein
MSQTRHPSLTYLGREMHKQARKEQYQSEGAAAH